jgi:hypothetical protein
MTKVINIKTKEPYDFYIGREGYGHKGIFGNPFSVKQFGREKCLELYKEYFYKKLEIDPVFKEKIHALKDKVLGCFCSPLKCHGHIIAEYLDNLQKI